MKHIPNEVAAGDCQEGCSCGCNPDDPCTQSDCPHCKVVDCSCHINPPCGQCLDHEWVHYEGD